MDTDGTGNDRTLDRTGAAVLDLHECLALLRRRDLGRLAVTIGDHPDIWPINYIVDHGTVVFRTAEGTKMSALLFGANVAFEVDGYEPDADGRPLEAWSVVVKGKASEIRNVHERFDAADLPLFPWHASPKPRFVRITPFEVSGRRFRVVEPTTPEPPPPPRASFE
jgi:uncharacterized protein